MQLVDPASGRSAQAIIVGPLDSCDATAPGDGATHGYQIRVDDEQSPATFLGIALSGHVGPIQQIGGVTATDLDADEQPEILRSCASSEGIHLTIWSGAALTGTRRWHGYQYLGYDVTPNCTEQETAPP